MWRRHCPACDAMIVQRCCWLLLSLVLIVPWAAKGVLWMIEGDTSLPACRSRLPQYLLPPMITLVPGATDRSGIHHGVPPAGRLGVTRTRQSSDRRLWQQRTRANYVMYLSAGPNADFAVSPLVPWVSVLRDRPLCGLPCSFSSVLVIFVDSLLVSKTAGS